MITARPKVTTFKASCFLALAILLTLATVAVAADGDGRTQSTVSASSPVTAVKQITHDGFSKTNLLSDDTDLYVTEWLAARHVIAKVSVQGADRSTITSPFTNQQAIALTPERTGLLVSRIGGVNDQEFWTLPINTGSPQRVGTLTGRDAAWSPDGKHLAFGKGSTLYLSNPTGTDAHELYSADGSVFAPRFSLDGRRIRFTVSDTEKNTTTLWEIAQGRIQPACSSLELAKRFNGVLRQLDSRWSLLHLSGNAEFSDHYHHSLGFARLRERRR